MISKSKDIREGQFFLAGAVGLFAAWMVQPTAAAIAGIHTGAGQWGNALTQPSLIWGVHSHVEQFWVADALTWAAVISGVVATYVLIQNAARGDSDQFLVVRHPVGGMQAIGLRVAGVSLVIGVVCAVGAGLVVSPPAAVVLGIPLAAGPILGIFMASKSRGGREVIPGDRIILGAPKNDRRHWVAARPDMSVFMLGAPSSGKTGGVIIPNLLAWDGAAVSTSTKFDVASETIRRRSELGQVWVWAPLDDAQVLPAGAHRLNYSPISGASDWRVASRHAHALAYGTASGETSKVWASSASQLIACALHACAISGEGMAKVIDSVKQSDWRWLKKTLEGPGADPAAMTALASLEGRNQTFRADMGANIDQALSLVLSGNLVDDGGGEQLDWSSFLQGRNTLYIVLPTELPHVDPAPYTNVLLADLVYAVRSVSSAHNYRLPYRLLMLLDELGALCSIDNLDNLIATQRSAGMSFLLAAQSLAQIDRRYGQGGTRTIRDAVGAIVLGMGVSDDEALRDMETLVGGGVSLQQQMGSGRNKKDAPEVIEDQADRWAKHQIAALAQYHFYVHLKGSSKPQHVKAPYFMDMPFKALWEGTASGPGAPTVEVLDGEGAIAEDDESQVLTLRPALDALTNRWVALVEDVWTRLTAPGLQLQIEGYAAEHQAALAGLELGHDVRGINVTGLNHVKPLRPGEQPAERPIMVVGDGERAGEKGEGQSNGDGVEKAAGEGSTRLSEELETEFSAEPGVGRVDPPSAVDDAMAEFPRLTAEPTYNDDLDRLFEADEPDPVYDSAGPDGDTAPPIPATSPTPAAPEPAAVAPKPSAERPNRYRGDCIVCGKRVEAKAGLTWRKIDRWLVKHVDCA